MRKKERKIRKERKKERRKEREEGREMSGLGLLGPWRRGRKEGKKGE